MNIATLKMPRLGETMEHGEIAAWLVKVGQSFERGEAILEVETDKTVVEYPALGAGVLAEILTKEGDTVAVGAPIARIDLGDAPDWTGADRDATADDGGVPVLPGGAPRALNVTDPAIKTRSDNDRLRATPVARRLARQARIDLGTVFGTGRRGRIEASDVTTLSDDRADGGVRFAHNIAFVKTGPLSGTPFLLIHGFAGDHTTFAMLTNGLKRAGCLAIACDLPGHGRTKIDAEKSSDLFVNLAALVHPQIGHAPFHLVAHSLGAVPALMLAETVDLASLTLIAPVGVGQQANAKFLAGMASPTSAGAVEELLDQLTETPIGLSKSAVQAIFDDLSRGRLVALADSIVEQTVNILPALEKLAKKIPTRILIGHDDRILGQVNSFDLPPEVAVHSFRNTGHMPHWEQSRAVLNILLAATR